MDRREGGVTYEPKLEIERLGSACPRGTVPSLAAQPAHAVDAASRPKIGGILGCAVSLIPRSASQTGAVLKQTAGSLADLNAKASEGLEHATRTQDTSEGVYDLVLQEQRAKARTGLFKAHSPRMECLIHR